MTLASRLKEARENKGFRHASDFAKHHGLAETTYRNHENGSRGIKNDQLAKYAELLEVSINWLMTGKDTVTAPTWADRISAVSTPDTMANIPVYRAKSDIFFLSEENIVEVTQPHPAQNGLTNAFAITLDTVNFIPRYYKGEKLYIQTAKSPMNGQDAIIINHDDQVTIVQMVTEDKDTITARNIASDTQTIFNKADIKDTYLICGTGI